MTCSNRQLVYFESGNYTYMVLSMYFDSIWNIGIRYVYINFKFFLTFIQNLSLKFQKCCCPLFPKFECLLLKSNECFYLTLFRSLSSESRQLRRRCRSWTPTRRWARKKRRREFSGRKMRWAVRAKLVLKWNHDIEKHESVLKANTLPILRNLSCVMIQNCSEAA